MDVPENSREARQKAVWAARRQPAAPRSTSPATRARRSSAAPPTAVPSRPSRTSSPSPGCARPARSSSAPATATRGYIRDAREAGHTWQQIGTALDLTPGGEAGTAAEAAYSYAAGNPTTETALGGTARRSRGPADPARA